MQIEKITFRNFGSYGNKTLTFDIPADPSFFLVQGKNGNGKSTLSDVIKFAVYGKLENKKLKDIANRLNKNAYVKVELLTRSGRVEIERGVEPGFFNLKVNGDPIDKAGKRSVQEFLEEELLENVTPNLSNSKIHIRIQQRNGRKLKSVSDRMKKKEGRIRGNLNGKRVDQSARSVITPDPYIGIDELGVPIRIALNITFPEIVNDYNREEITKLIIYLLIFIICLNMLK